MGEARSRRGRSRRTAGRRTGTRRRPRRCCVLEVDPHTAEAGLVLPRHPVAVPVEEDPAEDDPTAPQDPLQHLHPVTRRARRQGVPPGTPSQNGGAVHPVPARGIQREDGTVSKRPDRARGHRPHRPCRAGAPRWVRDDGVIEHRGAFHVPEAERQDVGDHDVVRRHRAAAVLHPDDIVDGIPDLGFRPGARFKDPQRLLDRHRRHLVGDFRHRRLVAHRGDHVRDRGVGRGRRIHGGEKTHLPPVPRGNGRDPPGDRARPRVVDGGRPGDTLRQRRGPLYVEKVRVEVVRDHHVRHGDGPGVTERIGVPEGEPRSDLPRGLHGFAERIPDVGRHVVDGHGGLVRKEDRGRNFRPERRTGDILDQCPRGGGRRERREKKDEGPREQSEEDRLEPPSSLSARLCHAGHARLTPSPDHHAPRSRVNRPGPGSRRTRLFRGEGSPPPTRSRRSRDWP
ncbi:MAG: hypothetical protein H6Q82_142 [Deltaproteobacteria bacterium]|nr:hypothetical protein [Deltaproteobacteria bacterium]